MLKCKVKNTELKLHLDLLLAKGDVSIVLFIEIRDVIAVDVTLV